MAPRFARLVRKPQLASYVGVAMRRSESARPQQRAQADAKNRRGLA